MKTLTIKDSEIEMKLATGPQVNFLSETDFQKRKSKPELKYAVERLSGYEGQPIKAKGKCSLIAENKGTKVESIFFIVPGTKTSLLRKKTCHFIDSTGRLLYFITQVVMVYILYVI